METVKAPGLKWRKLASGPSPVWVADEVDVKNGYPPKTANLKHLVGAIRSKRTCCCGALAIAVIC